MKTSRRPETDGQSLIAEFIRGQRPWRDLEALGVRIAFSDDGCDIEGSPEIVKPSVRDLAQGLLHHLDGPPHELQRWAAVILAGSAFIDLSDMEAHPEGDRLTSALWDASAGDPVDEHAALVARAITAE
jgi:hypothetical protein